MAEDKTKDVVSLLKTARIEAYLMSSSRLGLFIVNTIFAMQFNQILQITQEDPLIANR